MAVSQPNFHSESNNESFGASAMIFGGNSGFGMRASRRFGGHKRKAVQAETAQEVPEENGTAVSFVRKPEEREEGRKWSRLFAASTSGSPRLRGARKFTK